MAGGGSPAPGAAPAEPGVGSWLHTAQGFAAPPWLTCLANCLTVQIGSPQTLGALVKLLGPLQAQEKDPQTQAGEAIGVNFRSELKLWNSL